MTQPSAPDAKGRAWRAILAKSISSVLDRSGSLRYPTTPHPYRYRSRADGDLTRRESTLLPTRVGRVVPGASPYGFHKHDQQPFREAYSIQSPLSRIATASGRTVIPTRRESIRTWLRTSVYSTNHQTNSHKQAPGYKPTTNHSHSPEKAMPPIPPAVTGRRWGALSPTTRLAGIQSPTV